MSAGRKAALRPSCRSRNPRPLELIFWDLWGVAILAMLGLAAGLVINMLRGEPVPLVHVPVEARMRKAVARVSNGMAGVNADRLPASVDLGQLQQFLNTKRGFVFDARPALSHWIGHIPGSVSLPRGDFEKAYGIYQAELERDRTQAIIVYCSNPSCQDSSLVQKALFALGYPNVSVFPGGWLEWQKKMLPEEKGR